MAVSSDQESTGGSDLNQVQVKDMTQIFIMKHTLEWLLLLDTGSAAHLTNDRGVLDPGSIVSCNVEIVGIGGAKGAIVVTEKGNITMTIAGKKCVLTDVLLAEGANIYTSNDRELNGPVTLLSIRRLATNNNIYTLFRDNTVDILDHDLNIVASAPTHDDRLYLLKTNELQTRDQLEKHLKTIHVNCILKRKHDDVTLKLEVDGQPHDEIHQKEAATKEENNEDSDTQSDHDEHQDDELQDDKPKKQNKKKRSKLSKQEQLEFSKLIHARLHHGRTECIETRLKRMYESDYITINEPCDACAWAKSRMKTRSKQSRRKAKRIGERLHYDLFTNDTRAWGGEKYALIVVDEKSTRTWVRGLVRKRDVFKTLLSLLKEIENELQLRVQSFALGLANRHPQTRG